MVNECLSLKKVSGSNKFYISSPSQNPNSHQHITMHISISKASRSLVVKTPLLHTSLFLEPFFFIKNLVTFCRSPCKPFHNHCSEPGRSRCRHLEPQEKLLPQSQDAHACEELRDPFYGNLKTGVLHQPMSQIDGEKELVMKGNTNLQEKQE